MRVAYPSAKATLQGVRKENYLDGLDTPLRAGGSGLTEVPPAQEPLNFVVVEESGARHPARSGV